MLILPGAGLHACCSSRRPASHSFVPLSSPPSWALEAPFELALSLCPAPLSAAIAVLCWSFIAVAVHGGGWGVQWACLWSQGGGLWKSFCSSSRGSAMPYPLSGPFPSYDIPAYFPYCLCHMASVPTPSHTHALLWAKQEVWRVSSSFCLTCNEASELPSGNVLCPTRWRLGKGLGGLHRGYALPSLCPSCMVSSARSSTSEPSEVPGGKICKMMRSSPRPHDWGPQEAPDAYASPHSAFSNSAELPPKCSHRFMALLQGGQSWGWQFALQPQFSDGFKESHLFSACPTFSCYKNWGNGF